MKGLSTLENSASLDVYGCWGDFRFYVIWTSQAKNRKPSKLKRLILEERCVPAPPPKYEVVAVVAVCPRSNVEEVHWSAFVTGARMLTNRITGKSCARGRFLVKKERSHLRVARLYHTFGLRFFMLQGAQVCPQRCCKTDCLGFACSSLYCTSKT